MWARGSFAKIQELASKELTFEFLSSLTLDFQPRNNSHRDVISFRCLCQDRELEPIELNALFGFSDEGEKEIEWQMTIYDPSSFWKSIAPYGRY